MPLLVDWWTKSVQPVRVIGATGKAIANNRDVALHFFKSGQSDAGLIIRLTVYIVPRHIACACATYCIYTRRYSCRCVVTAAAVAWFALYGREQHQWWSWWWWWAGEQWRSKATALAAMSYTISADEVDGSRTRDGERLGWACFVVMECLIISECVDSLPQCHGCPRAR
jgi:hypothetical protein